VIVATSATVTAASRLLIAAAVEVVSVTLLQDTVYRRARAAVVRVVHSADEVVTRLSRTRSRILFEAASPLSLAIFRPVLERLQLDPRLEFWFTTSDRSWDAPRTFGAAGITERVISASQARWMKFDGYVNTDFWNMTWLRRRVRRVHLFHGVAGKYGLDAPVRIAPVVSSFDRLLFPNSDRLQRYRDAGLVEPAGRRGQLIGYPKVDCLVDGSLDRAAIQDSIGLDHGRPTVLYAPTWSPQSSLNTIGAELIPALARLDVNVVVKLHDRSYDQRSQSAGPVDWGHQLDAICRSWRVHAAHGSDVSPYLFAADVLVTDHSSVGFEFALLDRPIVVVDTPELIRKARVGADKVRALQSAATVVHDVDGATRAIVRSLADPTRLSGERRALADRSFYRPGSATARAVNCIYELLELPAPDGVRDVSAEFTHAVPSGPCVLPSSRTTHDV
jgi:CDP-Glycerol:Poly(glycerophosphate) glycerophosphotransferase